MSAMKERRGKLGVENHSAVHRGGNGADDEVTRRAVEGDGEEDHLVGSCGNHRGDGSDDEEVAGAAGVGWVLGLGGPAEGQAQRQTDTAGEGRGGAAVVSGNVFRSEHPALSREAGRGAWNQAELYLGAE